MSKKCQKGTAILEELKEKWSKAKESIKKIECRLLRNTINCMQRYVWVRYSNMVNCRKDIMKATVEKFDENGQRQPNLIHTHPQELVSWCHQEQHLNLPPSWQVSLSERTMMAMMTRLREWWRWWGLGCGRWWGWGPKAAGWLNEQKCNAVSTLAWCIQPWLSGRIDTIDCIVAETRTQITKEMMHLGYLTNKAAIVVCINWKDATFVHWNIHLMEYCLSLILDCWG